MDTLGKIILLIGIIVILLTIVFGMYRTWKTQNSENQKLFLQGKIPSSTLSGFYKGSVKGLTTTWQGKEFNATASSGINIFKENGKEKKSYPFKTYVGKGLQDKNREVFKIDYNISQNPLWLRFILDEIVEIKPNTYLGKLHIRLFPGVSFSLGYFSLDK